MELSGAIAADYRLRFLGDPVLKHPAEDVNPASAITELVSVMRRILAEERGLGLAAQQVGSTWRVALMRLCDGHLVPQGEPVVAINLRIIARSKKTQLSVGEGCL